MPAPRRTDIRPLLAVLLTLLVTAGTARPADAQVLITPVPRGVVVKLLDQAGRQIDFISPGVTVDYGFGIDNPNTNYASPGGPEGAGPGGPPASIGSGSRAVMNGPGPDGNLSTTGSSSTGPLVAGGVLLVLAGGAFMFVALRRRRRSDTREVPTSG